MYYFVLYYRFSKACFGPEIYAYGTGAAQMIACFEILNLCIKNVVYKNKTFFSVNSEQGGSMSKIKQIIIMAVLGLAFVSLPGTAFSTTSGTKMVMPDFSGIAAMAKPAVVNIRTEKTIKGGGRVFNFFGQPFGNNNPLNNFFHPFMGQGPSQDYVQKSLGSGFIISKDGYIVTNNHVVDGADDIKVKLANEKEYHAKVIGRDPKTDLALIKINAHNLIPLKIGSSDDLKVGNWVVAIGSPFGLEQTVTAGIVSAKGRIIGEGPYDDFIQTDASINPGNSGGPLLNMKGEVVGINTAIIKSGQGIGFAIPSDLAKGIVAQLKKTGKVTRGWMGVAIQDVTPQLAQYYGLKQNKGVLIAKVYKNNPAYKAGLKTGDIIISVNGKAVKSSRELSANIAGHAVGEKIRVTIIRNEHKKTLYVKLAERNDQNEGEALSENSETGFDEFGFGFQELNPSIAKALGYPLEAKGLVIAEIKPQSRAADTGLKKGDLLKEVNRIPVKTMKAYRHVLGKIRKGGIVQLLFRRGNTSFFAVRFTK